MRFPIALVLVAASLFAASWLAGSSIPLPQDPPGSEPGQVFVLKDFRWWPVIVRRTPTAVQCSFEVMDGSPTVHAELISESDFGQFAHQRDYEPLALTKTGHSGTFQRMIETPGRYRILVVNEAGAPEAAVSLVVRTEVDPAPETTSISVSPRRKLAVVFASLAFFFGTVVWSGRKLLRAYRDR